MQHYRTGDGVIFKVPEREIPIPAADLYPDAMRSAGADEASESIYIAGLFVLPCADHEQAEKNRRWTEASDKC